MSYKYPQFRLWENIEQALDKKNNSDESTQEFIDRLSLYKVYLPEKGNREKIRIKFTRWCDKKSLTKPIRKKVQFSQINIPGHAAIPVYYSADNMSELNHNGKVTNNTSQLIVCRHLAFWFLCHDKDYLEPMLDFGKNKFQFVESLMENYCDNNRVPDTSNSSSIFLIKDFGTALHMECCNMQIGDKQKFLFFSGIHAMSIVVHRKLENQIIIKFYDPNMTVVALRAKLTSLEMLKYYVINNFLTHELQSAYFPKFKVALLQRYDI